MVTFIQILLVAVLLGAMVLVLLIIGHIANPSDSGTKEQRDRLLHDVETRDRVVTSDNLFHEFLARPIPTGKKIHIKD